MFSVVAGTSSATSSDNIEAKLLQLKSEFDSRTTELSKNELEIFKTYTGEEREQKLNNFYNSEEVKTLQNDYKNSVLGDIELEKAYIQQLGGNKLQQADLKSDIIISKKNMNNLNKNNYPTDDYHIEKIIEHEDGSFNVLSGTLTEHKPEEGTIQPMAYTNGIGDYDFLWDFEYRHLVYPNSHFTLKTYYTTHTTSPHLKIYNVSNAGTRGQLPLVSVVGTSKITGPIATKSTKARVSGDFKITFAGYNGYGLHAETWDGNASFIIRDYTSTTVTISTEGNFTQR